MTAPLHILSDLVARPWLTAELFRQKGGEMKEFFGGVAALIALWALLHLTGYKARANRTVNGE